MNETEKLSNAKAYSYYADKIISETNAMLKNSVQVNSILKMYVNSQIAVIREALTGIERSLDLTDEQQSE